MNRVVTNESNNKINSTISLNVCEKITEVTVTAVYYENTTNY